MFSQVIVPFFFLVFYFKFFPLQTLDLPTWALKDSCTMKLGVFQPLLCKIYYTRQNEAVDCHEIPYIIAKLCTIYTNIRNNIPMHSMEL